MGIIRKKANIDVVTAAHKRVRNIFDSGRHVIMSFSGGKDSICLANVVYEEIQAGYIDPKQLSVLFVDEEAMYPDVIRLVEKWRKAFMLLGSKFYWLCIEVKHFNCFNNLSNDESFICWDRNKAGSWVRPMPKVAMRDFPQFETKTQFQPGKESYQQLLMRATKNEINIVGLRVAESVQRLYSFAQKTKANKQDTNYYYPIYDWKDNDVWLYLKGKALDFPIEYLYMWQVGIPKRALRISQFFSVDTAGSLVSMSEFYPDLMDRICEREPNAYLAALYWDSEMFRREKKDNLEAREKAESQDANTDYKSIVMNLLSDIKKNFEPGIKERTAKTIKKFIFKYGHSLKSKDWYKLYSILQTGDPKHRSMRKLYQDIGLNDAEARKQMQEQESSEAKKKVLSLLADIPGNFNTKHERWIAKQYKNQIQLHGHWLKDPQWEALYNGLKAGDPKRRTLRAIMVNSGKNKREAMQDE